MYSFGIIDANETPRDIGEGWIDSVTSIVGQWLKWEIEKRDLSLVEPQNADILFLVHAGAIDWTQNCRRYLKRAELEYRANNRVGPYVIAGGAVDVMPFTALEIADALAIGEAYNFVRAILDKVEAGGRLDIIRQWIIDYDHAIERTQISDIKRDNVRPWLLHEQPDEPLATPDRDVDWDSPPPVRNPDGVTRIVGSKGCWLKCKFCATTYRQPFQKNEDEQRILHKVGRMTDMGERVQIVTNDVASLPYLDRVSDYGRLSNQSLTIKGVSEEKYLKAIIRAGLKVARFGVEGLSERIRTAFGKPISNDRLLSILRFFHTNKRNSHMFYIINVPYEREQDWLEFREFYDNLRRVVDWGVCRLKYTAFVPAPPAPLARFVSPLNYSYKMDTLKEWQGYNAASRHILNIWGRREKSTLVDWSDVLQVPPQTLQDFVSETETTDLAPTLEDAYRLPWEIIGWPQTVEQRWHLGEVYKQHMEAS